MSKDTNDDETIFAILQQFNTQRFPRAQEIENRVNHGEKLNEADLEFLALVFNDAQHYLSITDRHPELQALMLKGLKMYKDITMKALENEGIGKQPRSEK